MPNAPVSSQPVKTNQTSVNGSGSCTRRRPISKATHTPDALSLAPGVNGVRSAWMHSPTTHACMSAMNTATIHDLTQPAGWLPLVFLALMGLSMLTLKDAWAEREFHVCVRDRDSLPSGVARLLDYLSRCAAMEQHFLKPR